MKNLFRKITNDKWILRSLISSVIFNFRHLPFTQACKLPILLYKPRLVNNTGKFVIEGDVCFGMIQLGKPVVSLYPNNGILIENRGEIRFKGRCVMGNNCSISLGDKGVLSIGDDFFASSSVKLICYHSISISENVRIGWESLVLDTDFHSMKSMDGKSRSKGYGEIKIGSYCWIASNCRIYKNTVIPSYCTVSSNTFLNKPINAEPCSLIYGKVQIATKYIGLYRDCKDDIIEYS